MDNEYFGFTESPFNVTSDPRFFYSNRIYQETFTGRTETGGLAVEASPVTRRGG